jgi:ABC-2 type transport system permease protein
MKFGDIFQFEFKYQLRYVSTWLLFAFLLLFGFLMPRIGTPTEEVYLNSNSSIAFITVFGGVIWLFMAGVVAGDAATRDVQTRMYSMTYTTPTSKASYLGGRFFAAFILNALIQLAMTAGMLVSYYAPGARTDLMGPFHAGAYLTAYGFISLPNAFSVTAIQFAVAQRRGRTMASYMISALAFVTSHIISLSPIGERLNLGKFEKVFDLTGIATVVVNLDTWTPYESNTRFIELTGFLLASRLVWIGIGAGALAYTYARFRFIHTSEKPHRWNLFSRRRDHRTTSENEDTIAQKPEASTIIIPLVVRRFDFQNHARQALAIAWSSFRLIAKRRGGFAFIAALTLGAAVFSGEWMQFLSVPLHARTDEVLRFFTPALNNPQTIWIVIPFLIVVYAGEILWRERESGVSELSDATPVPESILFAGQFLGLTFVIMMWMATLMGGAILIQIFRGYDNYEPIILLKALFGLQFVNYALFALLVLSVHVLVNQKYFGHMLALGLLGFICFSSRLGIEHKLLVYASDTGWSYSDMRGFDPFLGPWLTFKVYWASWALLLGVVAAAFWMRSKESTFKTRVQLAKRRLARHKWAAISAAIAILLSGGFIFYNTNILNEYSTTSRSLDDRAEYERRYGRYEKVAQPLTTGTKLEIDIYPDEGELVIRGTYRLVNKTRQAIDTIHIATIPTVDTKEVSFDRQASRILSDEKLGHQIYSLDQPLQPGDSLGCTFAVELKRRGFSHSGFNTSVVSNGSFFRSDDVLPAVGFQSDRRIRGAADRKKYGLPPRPEIPSLYDAEARQFRGHAELVDFEAIVSTAEDQTTIAPGTLLRTWTGDDPSTGRRRFFHYATNAPTHNDFRFFSAKYKVRKAEWVDTSAGGKKIVGIQIFHHPGHDQNLDRMIRSVQASLQYYTDEFGPYPYNSFSIAERPGRGRGMHAEATIIDCMEGFSLMNPGELDLPFHIVAHEVAHQWWGLQLTPAYVEGLGVLVESFATFSAMQVVENTLGNEHLRSYLRQVREEYETPRSRYAPPLLQANGSFMNYRKGPFALYAMTQYIGKDKVNDVLRNLLHRNPNDPLPTTLDLYRNLQSVTPDSLQYLVHDLFATNTLWHLKTLQATAQENSTGTWTVTLTLDAQKVIVDSTAAEIPVAMNEWIDIGVFAPWVGNERSGKTLYLKRHRIRSGEQTIRITVPRRPGRAGIDPNYLLIDFELDDNTKRIKIEGIRQEDEGLI